ncbi:cytochrome C nitrite reductase [Sphingomonas sp. RT2P30]|uniref:cytochrome C nitrite reductase n=1 Tax=Parasphingomonas halimpatiens TaxID=3096162 RepID=UPI002FC73C42
MMRRIALLAIGIVALLFGGYWLTHRPPAVTETTTSVAAAGVTLTSQTLALPDEKIAFASGTEGELLTVNCTACHSPEMILNQPHLAADKWQATIDKMRKAYHATIDPADDAKLVAALTALPAQRDTAK